MTKKVTAINIGPSGDLPEKPGEYLFVYHSGKACGIDFCCPCGKCSQASYLPFRDTELSTEPSWEFDGNMEKPTLKPSILRTSECKWHGYLTDGIFVEC